LEAVNSLRAPSIAILSRNFKSGQLTVDNQTLPQKQDEAQQNTAEDDGGDAEQQGMDSENVMPNACTADIDNMAEPNKPSPPAARKRTRSPSTQNDTEQEESPSKLRAAYKQSERRRRGRRAAAT
jgi:hypothetical protein